MLPVPVVASSRSPTRSPATGTRSASPRMSGQPGRQAHRTRQAHLHALVAGAVHPGDARRRGTGLTAQQGRCHLAPRVQGSHRATTGPGHGAEETTEGSAGTDGEEGHGVEA